ncbi:MAG: DUF6496 domain-containing protein [Terriglobia bacterium]
MPEKSASKRAEEDKREGKAPATQAGEFVREEVEHVRRGVHGARSPQQAIAIGLSKARRAGVKLPPPKGKTSGATRAKAARDYREGKKKARGARSPKRSRAVLGALKRESSEAASPGALSRQAHASASRRSPASRERAAAKAARTKGSQGRTEAARKASHTRQRRRARNERKQA